MLPLVYLGSAKSSTKSRKSGVRHQSSAKSHAKPVSKLRTSAHCLPYGSPLRYELVMPFAFLVLPHGSSRYFHYLSATKAKTRPKLNRK